jgi:CheY-like chemotaxis protein
MQSAFAMKSDVDKAIKAGCDDYISKPVSMNNLKEKIEKFITVPKVKIHQ